MRDLLRGTYRSRWGLPAIAVHTTLAGLPNVFTAVKPAFVEHLACDCDAGSSVPCAHWAQT